MNLLFSIFRFIRPLNISLGISTCFIVSYLLDFNNFNRFFDLCVVLVCYMVAGNMLNDVLDIDVDRINKPHRFLIQYPINRLYIFILKLLVLHSHESIRITVICDLSRPPT